LGVFCKISLKKFFSWDRHAVIPGKGMRNESAERVIVCGKIFFQFQTNYQVTSCHLIATTTSITNAISGCCWVFTALRACDASLEDSCEGLKR